MSEAQPFSDTQIAGLVIRVEEGWAYHSDLGLHIAPADCEAGLSVTEARHIFATIDALRERLAATDALIEAATALVEDADNLGEIIVVGKDGPRPDREPLHAAAKRAGRGSVSRGVETLRAALDAISTTGDQP